SAWRAGGGGYSHYTCRSIAVEKLSVDLPWMSCVRIFLGELHSWEWLGILMARIAVGLLFFLSGRGKLFVSERRVQMRQTLIEAHVPFPDINTIFVSAVEFGAGLLLIFGALTPIACVMLSGVMVMAIATTAV